MRCTSCGSENPDSKRICGDCGSPLGSRCARMAELRATMSLACLLDSQGKRDEARTMLAEIYGWFTEGFETADLKDAKALLDELNE